MKTTPILLFSLLVVCSIGINAQQGINYKAIINDADGHVLANTTITVQFTILENGTTPVYSETHNPATDDNGIIIVNIGEGSILTGDFNAIEWGGSPHFLKTEIDIGAGLINMGTTEFKAVPYALHAKTTEKIPILEEILATGNSANAQIKNVSNPTEAQDAATKAYVDQLIDRIEYLENITSEYFVNDDIDNDGDGYTENEGDCDDDNSGINPGATDTPGDGIDQNCDGLDGSNLVDVDGNVYDVVEIGDQIWMAENLRALHFADGSPLTKIEDDNAWLSMTFEDNAYCWYKNDSATYAEKYGALYNFAAAVGGIYNYSWGVEPIQGVCPTGWHLPTLDEWYELINNVEPLGTDDGWARNYLRSTEDWSFPGGDTYGFNAYPSQIRFRNDDPNTPLVFNDVGVDKGSYDNIILDETAAYWIKDQLIYSGGDIYDSYANVMLLNIYQEMQSYSMPVYFGNSVRCVKD